MPKKLLRKLVLQLVKLDPFFHKMTGLLVYISSLDCSTQMITVWCGINGPVPFPVVVSYSW